MTLPVTYVEINSPDLPASTAFFSDVFGWDPQPFASPDYLVAAAGDHGGGVDTGLLQSMDGQPRAIPVIRVGSLSATSEAVRRHGGSVVVEPFTITGVGRGCYVTDPAGVLIGLHEYDPQAG
jgi:predicted enzyme related to lactoylglutathione lyase